MPTPIFIDMAARKNTNSDEGHRRKSEILKRSKKILLGVYVELEEDYMNNGN